MKFDDEGHVVWPSPRALFGAAAESPRRLLTRYLLSGTPWAFATYPQYCDFLEAVTERTGIHPRNLYVRGSCHIGFSIAPRSDKLWIAMGEASDIDLVIVDADYFNRFDAELRRWESRNPVKSPRDRGAAASAKRAQDRLFNLCRDSGLPPTVCVHHQHVMEKIAALAHCGQHRPVNAFIYPDWHSAQQRYEFDLRELCRGVNSGSLTAAPEQPLAREKERTL